MVRFISDFEWKDFQELKTAIAEFLTNTGSQTFTNDEASKKLRKLRLENEKDIDAHLANLVSFINSLNPDWSSLIPLTIAQSLRILNERIADIMISLGSIETAYKLKDSCTDFQNSLKSFKNKAIAILTFISEKWLDAKLDQNITTKDLLTFEQTLEQKTKKPNYYNQILLWERISLISEETYEIQKITNPIRVIGEFIEIYTVFESYMKTNKTKTITLANFMESYQKNSNMNSLNKDLLLELLYYLKDQGFLKYSATLTDNSKEGKEKAKNEISGFVETLYKEFLELSFSKQLESLHTYIQKDVKKALSAALMEKVKDIESKIIEKYGNIQEAEKNIEKEYEPLYEILMKTEEWIKTTNLRIGKYSSVTRIFQKNISNLSHEFDRKIENFKQYADSVHDSHHRQELENILKDKLSIMENKLNQYEKETSNIIKNEIPQISYMEQMLIDFNTAFKAITEDVVQAFKAYKDKNVNVFPSIKLWEEKMQELKHRTIFIISNLFAMLFEKFKPVIDMEQHLFKELQELKNTADQIPLNFSLDLVMPQKLTEKQLRTRIKDIDEKINELEKIKEIYAMEKTKYQQILEENLKIKKNLVSRQCIICHKFIDVVSEEEVLKCEFCGSMSHYICGAWWIEKYNTCPVCNNSYTKPNSELFDGTFNEDK
jgi:hypothetical protein